MGTKDEIMERLRKVQRHAPLPGSWISRNDYDDLGEQFRQTLTSVKGEVLQADSLEEGLEEFVAVLQAVDASRVLVDSDVPAKELISRRQDIDWYLVAESEGGIREFAAAADLGLSLAKGALAETGSVLVNSGPGQSRLTSLLPPVHVVLVPASCLEADIFDWTSKHKGDLPASLTWISGPSKTADIEQTMAVGVHGPGRFVAILYDDEAQQP